MPSATLARLQRITPMQLRAFEAVARLLSVTAAANELHVSQPTISIKLKDLAETIGEPLFEVIGRRMRLTQTGELLYQTVQDMTLCWQRFEANMAAVRGLVSGKLRIAAVTTAEYFVPDLLGPFSAAFPGIEIELAIENRDRILGRLEQGLDELVVMMMPPTHLSLEQRSFYENPLVVIAPAHSRFAEQRISLTSLSNERWLMREPGSGTRMATEQFFQQMKFTPNVAMSLGSNEAIKHAVAAGLGIAVLSELALNMDEINKPSTPNLVVLDVSGFPIRRYWHIVWRREQPLSAAAKQFVHFLTANEEQ